MEEGIPILPPPSTTHSNFQGSLSSRQDPREGLLALLPVSMEESEGKGPCAPRPALGPQEFEPLIKCLLYLQLKRLDSLIRDTFKK